MVGSVRCWLSCYRGARKNKQKDTYPSTMQAVRVSVLLKRRHTHLTGGLRRLSSADFLWLEEKADIVIIPGDV